MGMSRTDNCCRWSNTDPFCLTGELKFDLLGFCYVNKWRSLQPVIMFEFMVDVI